MVFQRRKYSSVYHYHSCCKYRAGRNRHRSIFRSDSNKNTNLNAKYSEKKSKKTHSLTAIDALLLLFGLGTWKFLPSKSVLSSSSLELELSNCRVLCVPTALAAICACRPRRGRGMGGKVPWIDPCCSVP